MGTFFSSRCKSKSFMAVDGTDIFSGKALSNVNIVCLLEYFANNNPKPKANAKEDIVYKFSFW